MPVESMAEKGYDTLRFGPLKPVGLIDPHTGKEPYAVVQLRQDNTEGTLYNIVGFQTHLKWPEQKRVFGFIPGLENAEFVRYGVMHRNTYINSPRLLDKTYLMKTRPGVYFAGQITGVEGYIESASSGMVAGINAAKSCLGHKPVLFPPSTAIGALANHVSEGSVSNFQPMNANFGIMTAPPVRIRKKADKYIAMAEVALEQIKRLTPELADAMC
jgi:methylenetetrahydrofolate--tRNA-(uracil-5-)-methyltransferase